MKNRRLHYGTEYIRISKTPYIDYLHINYIDYNNTTILIKEVNILDLKQKLDKKGKSYKHKDLKWLFNQKAFISNLTQQPTLNQFRELKKCLSGLNKGEYMKINNLAKFINSDIETKFLERNRYILNVMRSNGLLGSVVRYGITEGIRQRTVGFKKGKDNPGFNHQGKFSSGSKNFIKYDGLSDKEKTELIKQVHNKISTSNKENGNNDCTMVYYTNQGYSEDEAKKLLSERQSTFSLKKCIEKFGEVDGIDVFNDRQQKWQDTLKAKPKEEINRINKAKGSGLNSGWGVQRIRNNPEKWNNKNAILYYIRFFNDIEEFWKVGITSNDILSRFGSASVFKQNNNLEMEVLKVIDGKFTDLFIKEQSILRLHKEFRIKVNYPKFSSYECFYKDILNLDDPSLAVLEDEIKKKYKL